MEFIRHIDEQAVISDEVFNKMIDEFNAVAGTLHNQQNLIPQAVATYNELTQTKADGGLIAGTQYLLIDYVTKYRQPYTNVIKTAEAGERLVLTAVSDNQFSPIVASLDYPQDVIYYDFDDNKCEDDSTPRTGFITRRIDTKNYIDVPQDWRTMLWARFKGTGKTWVNGTAVQIRDIYQSGTKLYIATRAGTPANATDSNYFREICSTNDYYWSASINYSGLEYNKNDYAERYTFNESNDLTLKVPTRVTRSRPQDIYIAFPKPFGSIPHGVEGTTDISLARRGLHNNVWYTGLYTEVGYWNDLAPRKIFASSGFFDNTFDLEAMNMNFMGPCYSNIFEMSCQENSFLSECGTNIFKSNYRGNVNLSRVINSFFANDVVANKFQGEILYSVMGQSVGVNTFNYCLSCSIPNGFRDNIIECSLSVKDLSQISELTKSYGHRIFKNTANAINAVHYVGTTPTYTAIP